MHHHVAVLAARRQQPVHTHDPRRVDATKRQRVDAARVRGHHRQRRAFAPMENPDVAVPAAGGSDPAVLPHCHRVDTSVRQPDGAACRCCALRNFKKKGVM